MKLILITGLDGSGKSSLINKLEENSKPEEVGFLRVPKIDSRLFKGNKLLYDTTRFINTLHEQADADKKPQLKVIAMFSSMLIFKELLAEISTNKTRIVFCERHPLVDTAVYAYFYSGSRMNPKNLEKSILQKLNNTYCKELSYLLSLLNLEANENDLSLSLLNCIHDKFSKKNVISSDDLSQIFGIDYPDKIYYLNAKPKVLIQRLMQRETNSKSSNNIEEHETFEALSKMLPVYEKILKDIKSVIIQIDANNFENLDRAFIDLEREYLR